MDGIFGPSEWNKEVFLSCGVNIPIYVLPHISEFHGIPQKEPPSPFLADYLKQAEGDYIFYSIGMWNERKNIPFLLKSFLKEFSATECHSSFIRKKFFYIFIEINTFTFSSFSDTQTDGIRFCNTSLTLKSQFFLPITLGRMAFSDGLLSISIRPLFRNALSPFVLFNVYSAALAKVFP